MLAVIYAIYNEGYVTTSEPLSRFDLSQEGVPSGETRRHPFERRVRSQEPLALLLLLQARRPARIAGDGERSPVTGAEP